MKESTTSDFKEITDINLSKDILLSFFGAYRRAICWEKTKSHEYEVLFIIALILMVPAALLFGGLQILRYYPIFAVVWWIGAIALYFGLRYSSDDSDVIEADKAIDTLKKAIKRGRIGLRRKEGAKDGYEIVGVYHNDLIEETIEDYIDFGRDEFDQLYNALDEVGAFPNRDSIIGKDILFVNESTGQKS